MNNEDIIGIFDMDTATISAVSRRFLSEAERKKEIFYGDSDIPKSFIVCAEKDKEQEIVFSRISSAALKLRAIHFLSE